MLRSPDGLPSWPPVPPRVLLVTPCFPPARGGIERTSGRLVEHLRDIDLRVVASRASEPGDLPDAPEVPVHLVPNEPRGGRKAIVALNATAAAIAIRRRPDVVLGMHIRAMPAARVAALSTGARTVVVVHAKEMGEQPGLARAAMRWADRVVAVSGYARDLALDAGAAEDRIRLLHPGVTPATQAAPPPSARPGPRTLVTVSRLDDRYKGHDVVLEALPSLRRSIPDVRWVVVGDGGCSTACGGAHASSASTTPSTSAAT